MLSDAVRRRLCVIAVTHNSAADLPAFLSSVASDAALAELDIHVVVADNASTDNSVDIARASGATVVIMGANAGYAAGINAGRIHARDCEALFIANPDLQVLPGALMRLLTVAQRTGGVAVPLIQDQSGRTRPSLFREPTVTRQLGEALLGDRWPHRPSWLSEMVREEAAYRDEHQVDWATGAALMIDGQCNDVVGDWDESFFLFSEEVDYASRVRRCSRTITFVPAAQVMHSEGGSGRPKPLLALMAANRVRYFRARHNRFATTFFAVAVVLQLAMRARDHSHRHAIAPVAARAISLIHARQRPPLEAGVPPAPAHTTVGR